MSVAMSVAMLVARTPRLAASRRQPALVVLLQAEPAIPERLRRLACRAGDENIEMRVPAGSNLEHGFAVRQAAMDHGEQDPLAPRFQLERHVAAVVPGERDLAQRI